MDANRFDTLARQVGTPTSRRAALGATLAGGVLGALGLGRAAPVVQAAQGQTCVLGFTANVRTGPSASRPFTQGAQQGQLQAQVSFTLSQSGNIEHGELRLPNNTSVPLVGQATGHSLQLRATLGPDLTLVAVGVGEQEIATCQGAIDGLLTGPGLGDLGDWHAVALQQGQSGASNTTTTDQSDKNGKRDKSDKGNKNDRQNQGAATATATAVSQGPGNQGSNTPGSGTASQTCPRGQTFCNREEGYCADLMVDPLNCGTCGNQCAVNNCTGGVCGEATASVQNCVTPFALCPDGCVNLQTNARNCGACDNLCPGSTCEDGACVTTPATGAQTGCQSPRALCNGQCVDISRDVFNCGACSTVCAIDEVCTSGKCVAQSSATQQQGACPAGQTVCGADCVDLTTDVFNCGACGNVCALDEDCRNGQCAPIDGGDTCPASQTRCGDACFDLQTDPVHCGACGTACASDETCAGGSCTATTTTTLCPEGQVRCKGVCREALPNFGSQGISCPGGGGAPTECAAGWELCNGACFPEGACQPAECPPGWGYCYGVCRDFQNDSGYCGGCSIPCTGGTTYCSGGTCVGCPIGQTLCSSGCVDTETDLNNCGGCGNLCGTQCINGECTGVGPTPGCAPGTTRCGNACVDLSRDSANCGACGATCKPNTECTGFGVCSLTEAYCQQQGQHTCGTYCSDLEDHYDCGDCGLVCSADLYCKKGLCYVIGSGGTNGEPPLQPRTQTLAPADQQTLAPASGVTCASGLDNCAGVCVDLSSDPGNCGTCGTTCDAGSTCQQGQCTPPSPAADSQTQAPAASSCPAGQTDCGGVCADLTTDPLNCGACGIACGPDSSCVSGVCSEPPAPDDGTGTAPEDDTTAETEPATETTTCLDAGGACDTGSPDTCCSGVCNDDGTCA